MPLDTNTSMAVVLFVLTLVIAALPAQRLIRAFLAFLTAPLTNLERSALGAILFDLVFVGCILVGILLIYGMYAAGILSDGAEAQNLYGELCLLVIVPSMSFSVAVFAVYRYTHRNARR